MLDTAYNLIDVVYAVSPAVVFHEVDDFHCHCGVYEIGSAYLDGSCAGEHEFDGVAAVHDASKSDDRDFTAFATCQTIRTATGRTAGPERPPVTVDR